MAPQGLVSHILLKTGELCFQFSGVASYKIFLMRWILKSASNEVSEILKNCVLCFIGYLWICIVHEVWLEVDLLVGLLNVRSFWDAVCAAARSVTLDCLEQREPAFFVTIAYSVLSFYTGSCLHLVPQLLQWMRR